MPHRLALLILFLWAGLGGTAARGQEDDLAKELPRIQPLEPDAALKSFRLHEGFRLQTVAVGAGRDRPGERLSTTPTAGSTRSRCADIRTPRTRPPATSAGSKTATATASSSGARSSSTACRGRRACCALRRRRLHRRRPRHPLRQGHRRRRRGRREEGRLHRLRHPERPGARQRPAQWGLDGWIYGVSGGNGGDIRNPSRPGRQARLGPRPRLPVQARRLAPSRRSPAAGSSATPSTTGGTASPATTATTSARSSCPPATWSATRRWRPRRCSTDIAAEGAAAPVYPDQPGRALADRPDPPARGRPGVSPSGSRRPSWSPPASSPRPPA